MVIVSLDSRGVGKVEIEAADTEQQREVHELLSALKSAIFGLTDEVHTFMNRSKAVRYPPRRGAQGVKK